ncbi:MAG: response regulator transcription factor [Chloroflexota bacterium]|nr:response regulator transcription factor [Chloroflexota bacterium]
MADSKILIVEDDHTLLEVLRYNLDKEGFFLLIATDGVQALERARSESPDLIILDVMIPELDGFEVCRILRKETTVPILMLTAKEEEIDKVLGLELGADDYMTKPFSMRELKARIKAMLRRTEMLQPKSDGVSDSVLKVDNLTIDLNRRLVTVGETAIALKPREFDLLAFLARSKGRVFSRDTLLEQVWSYDYAGDTRTVDVHIRWLRQKMEIDPSKPKRLITVRGIGYKLEG